MIFLNGCYSIAEDGSKHHGTIILKTNSLLNSSSSIDPENWKNATFTPFGELNCNSMCNTMMECNGWNQPKIFLELGNILILGFFLFLFLCIAYGLTKILRMEFDRTRD